MLEPCEYRPLLPPTSFSFSVLVTSPIRCNLPFSPVSALIFPLAKADIYLSALIIAALDIFTTFLMKWSLAHPPCPQPAPTQAPITLTTEQLTQLIQAAANGSLPLPPPPNPLGQGLGSVGEDEPLFPDNLSFSLIVAAPFAPFDGSPDTSFNVPLFEIPGAPGNLIIAFAIFVAQFLVERTGLQTPGCQPQGTPNMNGPANAPPSSLTTSSLNALIKALSPGGMSNAPNATTA